MRIIRALGILLFVSGTSAQLHAYDADTHRAIARRSAQPEVSSLDQVLKAELGMGIGIGEKVFKGTLQEQTLEQLIGKGAFSEDDPVFRVLNHFHNPLAATWGQAGLKVLGVQLGQSSILWQQTPAQDNSLSQGGNWSWQDARQHYLNALIRASKEDRVNEPGRDTAFAGMFEALGHLTHLVQDASVPAHVRNDPHPFFTLFGVKIPINPDWYEDWVEETRTDFRDTFQALLNATPIRPPQSIFTATNSIQAPAPIARLIDTGKFLEGSFVPLSDQDIGIAEYTNGNYLSRDTIFTDFVLPRQGSLGPGFLEPEGQGFRRYFPKVADGETTPHFVTEGALFDSIEATVGSPPFGGWLLDSRVHQDYAAKLLPRAVGYSAALLDYFFRGKLEVDLLEDPVDPSVLRLAGTNASTERLDGGTLVLYADDPAGTRSAATALDPALTVSADPGAPVSSARFQAPENTERFVAVYQGTLGGEVKPPDSTTPGAVIGKVLGGVRVEEVFSDGTRWKIRSPTGVFVLPLMVAEFEEVTWGDADNTLLASTPFGPGQPNRFVVYEVQRQPDSVAFKTGDSPDGPLVQVSQRRQAVFRDGLSLSTTTTVQVNQDIQYRQRLGKFDRTDIYTWTPVPPSGPNDGYYEFDRTVFGPLAIETAWEQTVGFNLSTTIVLDLDNNTDFSSYTTFTVPYMWRLQDVSVDPAGRILGLIAVFWADPESVTVEIPAFVLNSQGDLEVSRNLIRWPETSVEDEGLLWALVDLSTEAVVASTASPMITLSSQKIEDGFSTVYAHLLSKRVGGPQAGTTDLGWEPRQLLSPTGLPPITSVSEVVVQQGVQAISMDGWLREELREEVIRSFPLEFQLTHFQGSEDRVYDCVSTTSCSAIRFVGSNYSDDYVVTGLPPFLADAERSRPAADGERLVFIVSPGAFEDPATVMLWDPGSSRAETRIDPPVATRIRVLGPATRTTAVVRSFYSFSGVSSTLVSLEGAPSTVTFPNVDLTRSFSLLPPNFLYKPADGRFYRLQSPLQRTALPAKLADVLGTPKGDYHTIRLP